MSDDLISREAVIEVVDRHTREDGTLDEDISVILEEVETAFDKEKTIDQLKEVGKRKSESIVSYIYRKMKEGSNGY